jgi:hypothetical protein
MRCHKLDAAPCTAAGKCRTIRAVAAYLQDAMNPEPPKDPPAGEAAPRFRPRPWIDLQTPQDVEAWIDEHNRSMQEHIGPQETGYGVCFTLTEGGNIFLQTNGDAVILDVEPDAQWVAPLLVAATQSTAPVSQIWVLPDDKLIQLIVGLSSLVASTTLFTGHNFGSRSRKLAY